MKLQIFAFSFVFIAFSSFKRTSPKQSGLSEQDLTDIREFFKSHDESVLSADWATVSLQYTEDAIRFPPGGDPIKGRLAIREGLEVVDRYIDFSPEIFEIEGHGNNAYALANFSATFIIAEQLKS